jgi:hypothetical protein
MAKHPNHVLENNARVGAMTTWCPNCNRKAALSAVWYTDPTRKDIQAWRTCRYCKKDVRVKDQQAARRRLKKSKVQP